MTITPELSLLGGLALRTGVVLLIGWAAVRLLRNRSSRLRYELVVMTMAVVLLIPVLHVVLPSLHILPAAQWASFHALPTESLSNRRATTTPVVQNGNVDLSRVDQPPSVVNNGENASSNAILEAVTFVVSRFSSLSLAQLVFLIWAAGAGFVGLRFMAARLRLGRLWSTSLPMASDAWQDVIDEAGDRVFLTRTFETRELAGIRSPMTWGVFAPRLLLPVEARAWSRERKLNALMHEMVHIRRLDAIHDVLSTLTVAMNWFNPFAWTMRSELKAQRESSCDREVLELGAQPEEYARMLIDVAKEMRQDRAMPRLAMTIARPSQLEGRVLSVLNFKPTENNSHGRLVLLASMTFTLLFSAAVAPARGDMCLLENGSEFVIAALADDEEKDGQSDHTISQNHQPLLQQDEHDSEGEASLQREGENQAGSGLDVNPQHGPSIVLDDIKFDDLTAGEAIGDMFAVAGIRFADAILDELAHSTESIDWAQIIEDAEWDIEGEDWSLDNIDVDFNDKQSRDVNDAMSRLSSKLQFAIVEELETVVREEPESRKARRALKALIEMDSSASRRALKRLGMIELGN